MSEAPGKLLAYILRHRPDAFGLALDRGGWVDVESLLRATAAHGQPISPEALAGELRGPTKMRFELSEDGRRIRALQGHSVEVDLELETAPPPDTLYHGTVSPALEGIRARGIERGARHHVHLSADEGTARQVGGRRGRPVVLVVAAGRMHAAGFAFLRAKNGVWLTEHVPVEYLTFPE